MLLATFLDKLGIGLGSPKGGEPLGTSGSARGGQTGMDRAFFFVVDAAPIFLCQIYDRSIGASGVSQRWGGLGIHRDCLSSPGGRISGGSRFGFEKPILLVTDWGVFK